MLSGCAGTAATLPWNRPRKKRSLPAAWSWAVTCTSSWFISQLMRSFATTVSNAKLSGAMSTFTKLRGTAVAAALPWSAKSSSSTVTGPEGVYEKSLRWKPSAFSKQRPAWGAT